MRIRIGTKRSALAKAQADYAMMLLREAHPNIEMELYYIASTGENPFESGLETGEAISETQQALLDGVIDVAVSSLKEISVIKPVEGTLVSAVLSRADPRDALVTADKRQLPQLERNARIGMGSARRRVQIEALRPDLKFVEAHGELQNRVRQLQCGVYDGVVLGVASLVRMHLLERASQIFNITELVPAPGQGAIALQVRDNDASAYTLTAAINHEPTRLATLAERSFLASVGGNGDVPVGAFASLTDNKIRLIGMVSDPNGARLRRDGVIGDASDAMQLGQQLALKLKV